MMRSVGDKNRSPFVLDPQEAWRLGRRADAQLLATRDVRSRGVIRAPHRILNELDDQRQLQCAQGGRGTLMAEDDLLKLLRRFQDGISCHPQPI